MGKEKVVKPAVTFVTETVPTFFDKVGDVLEAGGNIIAGLASTKFGVSGTVAGGNGNDLIVGLIFGSITDFLKVSFTSIFKPSFWTGDETPLQDFA